MVAARVHQFTESGLGDAPFRLVKYEDAGTVKCGVNCQHCGMAIRHHFIIADANGRKSVVGSSCINKVGDDGLRRSVRVAKVHARDESRRLVELDRQRERNGGLTDNELRERLEREHEVKKAKRIVGLRSANKVWIKLLKQTSGPWANGVRNSLSSVFASELSSRTQDILADIYAKQFGRKNSAAYIKALDKAYDLLDGNEAARQEVR